MHLSLSLNISSLSNFEKSYFIVVGVEFFRQRIDARLIEIFIFDDRHYMAMCLHPILREMSKRGLFC